MTLNNNNKKQTTSKNPLGLKVGIYHWNYFSHFSPGGPTGPRAPRRRSPLLRGSSPRLRRSLAWPSCPAAPKLPQAGPGPGPMRCLGRLGSVSLGEGLVVLVLGALISPGGSIDQGKPSKCFAQKRRSVEGYPLSLGI